MNKIIAISRTQIENNVFPVERDFDEAKEYALDCAEGRINWESRSLLGDF